MDWGCLLFSQTHLIGVRPVLSAYIILHSAFLLDIMSEMFAFHITFLVRLNMGYTWVYRSNGHFKKMMINDH